MTGCLPLAAPGTQIAMLEVAMMWLELITIYLAIGAPFAVNLGWSANPAFAYRKALLALFVWPLIAIRRLLKWLQTEVSAAGSDHEPFGPEEQAQRAVQLSLTALSRALPLLTSAATAEQLWQQCRLALEKYTGLTSEALHLSEIEPLGSRATELYTLAGRQGADVALAARCLQRRNARLLKEHQMIARQEFQQALLAAHQVVNSALKSSPSEATAAVYVEELWLGFLESARHLCLTLQDELAAPDVTRRLADARANRIRPALPAKEKSLPLHKEVEKCTPETQIAFPHLPAGVSSHLG
jgi:hypothetical protein